MACHVHSSKYISLNNILRRRRHGSYTDVPAYTLLLATSHQQHREQEDQEHRLAETQNDEVWPGQDDYCDLDLSRPPAEDEVDASESRDVWPS